MTGPKNLETEATELLRTLIRNACVNDGTPASGHEERNADALEEGRHLRRLGELERECQALDALALDLFDDLRCELRAAAVGQHAVGAVAGEPERDAAADAARAPRHHGHAPAQRPRRGRCHQARKSRQSASHMVADRRRLSVSMRSLLPWNMSGYSV